MGLLEGKRDAEDEGEMEKCCRKNVKNKSIESRKIWRILWIENYIR